MAVPLTTAMQTQIANLYISILGRNPDPVGFGYWCDVYANANGTQAALDAIASGFGKSPEFTGIYSGQTPAAAVALMYNNILGRTQDAAGATYWTGIANGYITSGRTVGDAYALTANAMITAAAANTGTADATLIANKQSAAVTAGTSTPTTTYTLTTGIDTATASTFIGVFDGAATGTYASGDTLTGTPGRTGNSIQLTVSADGSAVVPTITNIQTLQVRSINAAAQINAGITGLTTLANNNSIANVAFTSAVGTANTINLSNATSGTVGTIVTYTNNTFGSTTAAMTVNLSAYGASTVAQAFEARVGGNDVVTSLTINGTGTNRITMADNAAGIDRTITTLNLGGTGSIRIDGANNSLAQVTTINASTNAGGVNVDLASGGNTRNVTFTGGAGNDRISFAAGALTTSDTLDGGAGTNTLAIADQAVTNAANAALITAIKAAPTFTVLELTGTATTGTTLQAANVGLNNYSFTGAFVANAGAANGTGVTAYAVTGQANANAFTVAGTITGGAGGAANANNNGQAGGSALSFTPTLDNGSNALTLVLNGTTLTGGAGTALAGNGTADGAGGHGLAATAFETITITSQGTSANSLVGGAAGGTNSTPAAGFGINVNTNATITITGAQDINLGTVGGTNVNISASALTGKLTAAVANGNQTVTGGSANDTITVINNGTVTVDTGAGNDLVNIIGAGTVVSSDASIAAQVGGLAGAANHAGTVTLGAGTDTVAFYGSTLANMMTSSAGTTAVMRIADFTTGVDKIGLVNQAAAFTSITLATAQTIATAANLTEVYAGITAIGASTNGGAASGVVVTVSAGASAGTYLYINDATGAVSNSTDFLVRIVGSTTLATTDFVFA